MTSFQDHCTELAGPETFDPRAFVGTHDVPQGLCNFVLCLALIYNDLKDALYAYITLEPSRPPGEFQKTRLWGAYSGGEFHIFRTIMSLLHELFNLIRDNATALEHDFFVHVLQQLQARYREAWETVVAVANGISPSDPLGKSLLLIRNNVLSHYGPKALGVGFQFHFIEDTRQDERAFTSRGRNMSASRFYFADAAAIGYLRSIVGRERTENLLRTVVDQLKPVNHALMGIVDGFIQQRGCAYRAFKEGVA